MKRALILTIAGLLLMTTAVYAQTPPDGENFRFVTVASGFTRPLYVTHAGDDSGRLFVVEQTGRIWIVSDGIIQAPPFLDIGNIISQNVFSGGFTERGLLGLAFHPDYAENGQFFVHYSGLGGETVIARYNVAADNPNVADSQSAALVFTTAQPFPNHNGGQLAFGPDGYLYVGLGDGGSSGDPNGNGQNPSTVLGSLLRIDIDSEERYDIPPDNPFVGNEARAPEIWAWGLRNPWRFSFDRATGDLYIADVGQNQWEEINFQPADSSGGENYGWNLMEGKHPFSGLTPPTDLVGPVTEYDRSQGISVTGGYVYRGSALPELEGVYFFGDWGSGAVWALYRDAAGEWQTRGFIDTDRNISSFGEDEQGELYLVDYGGAILSLEAAG